MRLWTGPTFRWLGCWVILAGAVCCRSQRAGGQAPPTPPRKPPPRATSRAVSSRPTPGTAPRVTDEHVDRAVARGLKFLFSVQAADGTWDTRYKKGHEGGTEALVLLTALTASRSRRPPDARLQAALKHLDALTPETVYVRAFRTMVYARLPAADYADRMKADAEWLAKHQGRSGGWGYGPNHSTTRLEPNRTDSSNTQLAVLALREAAERGTVLPKALWLGVGKFWTGSQNSDGGWGYVPPSPSGRRLKGSSHGSMAAAGVASLLSLLDSGWGTADDQKALGNGFAWLTQNYSVQGVPGWVWGPTNQWPYYYLWTLARACNHAGVRDIGGKNWYRELVAEVLSHQRGDGGWSTAAEGEPPKDAVVRTCFALLALMQARAPVLAGELGGRAGTLGAMAGMTRWLGASFGRPVTWGALATADGPREFAEAPLLYIDVRGSAELQALPGKAIRDFVLGGGTVVVNTPVSSKTTAAVQKYFVTLFQRFEYLAHPISANHAIWSVHSPIPPESRPKIIGVSDACRTRIFILADGIGKHWSRSASGSSSRSVLTRLAVNLLLYTTNLDPPRSRLARPRPAPTTQPSGGARRAASVARVRHAGGWAACPTALFQLSRVLTEAVSVAVEPQPAVDLNKDVPSGVHVLWMTGSRDPKLSAEQKAQLKKYVESGGTLFVDSTVGQTEFATAVGSMLETIFGEGSLQELGAKHPLITGEFGGGLGSDIRKVRYTRGAGKGQAEKDITGVMGVQVNGRLAVIFSHLGVTCPLEGLPTYGCAGFAPDDARRLAANVILYALTER